MTELSFIYLLRRKSQPGVGSGAESDLEEREVSSSVSSSLLSPSNSIY